MPRFVLNVGEPVEFDAPDASGFLEVWRGMSRMADADDDACRRTAAALACDWSGKPIRFDTLEDMTSDMMRHGMLEAQGVQG